MLSTKSRWRFMSLLLMALLFIAAGINHFVNPDFYLKITPDFVPWPLAMIYLSGVFEVLGGIGVLIPKLRWVAGWGLIALLIAVSPVHVDMLVHADRFSEVPMWALVTRLLLQPLLIGWVWWTTEKFTFHCREIIEADWPAILRIQSEVYYEFTPESEVIMRSKAACGPGTSIVAVNQNSAVIAYCLAHPYPQNRTAVLGATDSAALIPTDNLFVHDLAVRKATAGRGVALALFNHLTSVARATGYRTMSLVAVQNAAGFWTKMGFSPCVQATIDGSYSGVATFMTKTIERHP